MTTKDDKETFFTSFLLRDKAFKVIKQQLGGEEDAQMLKRVFLKKKQESGLSNSQEGEEEEEEDSDQDEEVKQGEVMGQSEAMVANLEMPQNAMLSKAKSVGAVPEEIVNGDQAGQVLLDLKDRSVVDRLSNILKTNTAALSAIDEELDPSCNPDYQQTMSIEINNMTIPMFYNRIYGKCCYKDTQANFLETHTTNLKNWDYEVSYFLLNLV